MNIITIRTGTEKCGNRLYTTYFYLLRPEGMDPIPLTEHASYMPHEQIICGLNSCFGEWEIGHVTLPDKSRILGVLTKKVLAYDIHTETQLDHYMIELKLKLPGVKNRQYTRNYWGYNGGQETCVLISGKYDIISEEKKSWPLTTTLSKLPF